jgi:prepilin-type N-terminal cleavage/methylation domain-containing protein
VKNNRGYTLIELLIVIAMISILSGAMFTVVTGPLQEWKMADVQSELESGVGLAVCKLIEDAADAKSLEYSEEDQRIDLLIGDETVVYFVDENKSLRRVVGEVVPNLPSQGALLVPHLQEFTVTAMDSPDRYHFVLTASQELFHQDFKSSRSIKFTVGRPWLEVAR